ncbi:MAG: hypothetical protein PHH93_09175 [Prolixibacteraceae bacterium]|nr:hypothetical protein [Prolixibacteraceae bacterium]
MVLSYIEKYFEELWLLVLEMAPWLVLGLIFAGLLKITLWVTDMLDDTGRSDSHFTALILHQYSFFCGTK